VLSHRRAISSFQNSVALTKPREKFNKIASTGKTRQNAKALALCKICGIDHIAQHYFG